MKKLYEKDSQLLQRKRIAFEISHEKKSTPTREELEKQIASELKVNENLIAIRHIFTNFGENKSKVIINLYNNEDTLKKLETKQNGKEKKTKEQKTKPKV